jgi:hypothetical protein
MQSICFDPCKTKLAKVFRALFVVRLRVTREFFAQQYSAGLSLLQKNLETVTICWSGLDCTCQITITAAKDWSGKRYFLKSRFLMIVLR